LIIGLTVLLIPLLLPVWKPATLAKFYRDTGVAKAGMLKWEDQQDHSLPQDFADMLGWKELALKTKHFFYSNYPKSNAVIFCDNYGQAGSLIYYGKDDYFSYRIISANGSFLLWIPDRLWFKDLIYVGEEIPGKESEVFKHFEKMTVVDSVTNPYSRQFGNKIIFYENIDSIGLALAVQQIQALKNKFN
jgi:hypothetical protein